MNNLEKQAYVMGYMNKEAEGAPAKDWWDKAMEFKLDPKYTAAIGGAAGIGAGLLGNWVGSKLFGYDDNARSYLIAAGLGGATGGIGGYGAGQRLGQIIKSYQDDPDKLIKLLKDIDESEGLRKFSKWQRKSPLMKPIRRMVGRVLTNVQAPLTYDMEEMRETIDKHGIMGVLRAAWEDRPLYDPSASNRTYSDQAAAQRAGEAPWRAAFDLPTRKFGRGPSADEHFIKHSDKEWGISDKTDYGKKLKRELELKMRAANSIKDPGIYTTMLGGSTVEQKGNTLRIRDPWDFSTRAAPLDLKANDDAVYGYESTRERADLDRKRAHQRRLFFHYLRNIGDKSITNPVTFVHHTRRR